MNFDPPLPDDEPKWSPPSLAAPPGQWITQDERILLIQDMSNQHLQNAIALFSRFGFGDRQKIRELRRELSTRPV